MSGLVVSAVRGFGGRAVWETGEENLLFRVFEEGWQEVKELTDKQANRVVGLSLMGTSSYAVELVNSEFCSDCPWRRESCFPCSTAKLMVKVYLDGMVEIKARLN